MTAKGRKPPLGGHGWISSTERRETATTGRSEFLTNAFSTSALSPETPLLNYLIDKGDYAITWFEVTPINLELQLEQSLATLAAFAKPT